ncbi:hypothetical protein PG999_008845 [Apiospora kogelbergensis]|uniref:Oxidase ustYa n=2 Tax=Apiospora kogelbergensis TaxID=1337665 RepID=A0AAW0QSW8_9PEZI
MESGKDERDEEEQAFLPPSGLSNHAGVTHLPHNSRRTASRRTASWWWRLLLELTMAGAIVALIFFPPFPATNAIKRTPVPQLPRKIYTFHDNPRYMRGDMFFNESDTLHTLNHWIELSSGSRGYVVIKDADRFDLPDPYTVAIDRDNEGPGYMMSAFHQLHCLSYLAEHLQQGYAGINLTEKVAHHTAHCFNYLRQGIMCSADTTLEGKTEAGPGEGSEHECVDYDALLEWANNNSAYKWRGLLPDEAVL